MQDIIKKADILIEALPYIRNFSKKIFVIKYGGSILAEKKIRAQVLEDIVFLSYVGIKTILVHGGGPNITQRMKSVGKKTEFFEGMRVTDLETLKIVEEELSKINKMISEEIKKLGGKIKSISGKEEIIFARKKRSKKDLGFVGEVMKVNKDRLLSYLKEDYILVISPMGKDKDNRVYNINADEVASNIAISLPAEKFVILTNVKGIMRDPQDSGSLLSTLSVKEAQTLLKERIIQEGMIPKLKSAIRTVLGGVKKTHIIDARIAHSLLLEIFTDKGIGTEIIK